MLLETADQKRQNLSLLRDYITDLYIGGSQAVVPRSVVAASHGDLLEMQILGPQSRNLGIEVQQSVFKQAPSVMLMYATVWKPLF